MRIPELVIFAHATRGAALEVANDSETPLAVCEVRIIREMKPAEKAVCWITVEEAFLKAKGVLPP